MNIALITIGAELLNGTRIDTNAAWIGWHVIPSGGEIKWHRTVPDEKKEILSALNDIPKNISVVLMTGGLGPTHDDITSSVLYEYFKANPLFDEPYWKKLSERFKKRGREIPESNRNQAMRPDKGKVIDNPIGSARGLHFTNNRYEVFSMPGVPAEMQSMMHNTVLPWIVENSKNQFCTKTLRTTGIMESALYEKLEPVLNKHTDIDVAFLPKFIGVDIRIFSKDLAALNRTLSEIYPLIKKYHFGEDKEELEDIVGSMLAEKHLTIATAESCTGGLIGDRLTNTPGSSAYVKGGIISYSNEVKQSHLGVQLNTLKTVGAVSEETAKEMADGVRKSLKSDIGLSSTGIAGPGGGTKEKPVGLVYIGLADNSGVKAWKYTLLNHRKNNKLLTSQIALNLLRLHLLNV